MEQKVTMGDVAYLMIVLTFIGALVWNFIHAGL